MDDETAIPAYAHTELRRSLITAGYRGDPGDLELIDACLDHDDASIRSVSLSAAGRVGRLTDARLISAFDDPEASVRRRAAELAANRVEVDLTPLLHDDDSSVIEVACWAVGEHVLVDDTVLERLTALSTAADDPLVRESATAALGAIGDRRGLRAILTACGDKPAIRRRAVLALAPFIGGTDDGEHADDEAAVATAIDTALADRDWQVRQAAEDLRRASGSVDDDPSRSGPSDR